MVLPKRRLPRQVRFSISERESELLRRMKLERCKNVSAWLRTILDAALTAEFGAAALDPETPLPPCNGLDGEPGDEPGEELALDDPHVPMPPADELRWRRAESALVGWRPVPLPGGGWGACHDAAEILPDELVGRRIVVTDKRGRSWTSEILEVVERTPDAVLARDRSRYVRRHRPDPAPAS